jgi:hypothetical protein
MPEDLVPSKTILLLDHHSPAKQILDLSTNWNIRRKLEFLSLDVRDELWYRATGPRCYNS